MPLASSVMMPAVRSCPGSTTVCALAAAMARAATSAEPRTLPAAQPGCQAGLSEAADPIGGGVAGEQDQRSFVRGVVESPLQAGKYTGHQVAQPVDHAHPVGDQVRSMPGQHREVANEVGTGVDDRQIPAQASGLSDDVGVLGVGLAFSGIGSAHRRDDPPRRVTHRLAGPSQQGQQQRRRRTNDVDGPDQLPRQRARAWRATPLSQPRRWRP